jgi:DNA-binding SARP family transcriptional activator
MFRLRVLGGFALEGPSEDSTFPVPQRRAEAVLAALAVCGDLGCSRERLMALLWPESDEARSRSALRSTLHTIRQALGPGAVLSAGELLRLDASVVNSDVGSFARALDSDRDADAVRSYGGPLLEGFHLDGAPDFERWLDGERTRLAREYAEALERLATTAERAGAWGEAASWWAHAEEHDPLNSRFALQHARALVVVGDRANAVKVAEVHVRRLREELDMEPDREVLAEMEGIRRGDVGAVWGGRAHPVSAPPTERPRMAEEPPAHPDPLATLTTGTPLPQTSPVGATRLRRRRVAVGMLGVAVVLAALGLLAILRGDRKPAGIPLDATAIAVLPFQVVGADSASPARTLARFMGVLFELKVTGEFGRHIRHPGSVAERWRAAGGTLDSALSEKVELSVARAVGAGRLVRGTVVAVGDSLVVSASMVNVATGAVRVTPVRVEGTINRQQELVDRLITLLLARDAGVSPESARQLAQYRPEAIQAFLAGNRAASFADQKPFYHAALAADSNLVDAAVMMYAVGESVQDTAELRYAWEHQDKLTERGRAYLQVLAAGRHGPIRTEAQKIAGYEALALRWPEWRTPWGEVGDQLTNYGALASVPDWRRRARDAFAPMDRRSNWVWWHLTELAFMDGDAAQARAAIESLAAKGGGPGLVAAYRWRLAVLEGDTAEATRALSHPLRTDMVLQFALADGRGVAQAERVAAHSAPLAGMWAWARGREPAWREAWRRHGSPAGGISEATVPVFWALLLGPSQDTMAAEAVRSLERMTDGRRSPNVGADDRTLARCWVALWRLQHGDTAGARATRRYLESDVDWRYRFAGWTRLIDVLVTEAEGGDVRAALLRMDSVVRELPLPTGSLQWDPTPSEVHNLMLARMLRRYGEPERALAAVRRRVYRAVMNFPDALPEYLREEGRLAALVGDTAGALRAYRHYLALRENPDPPWRAPWDSVRAELAALVRR